MQKAAAQRQEQVQEPPVQNRFDVETVSRYDMPKMAPDAGLVRKMKISKIGLYLAYVCAGMLSIAAWVAIAWVTGAEEAWDSKYYWIYSLPAMMFLSGVFGFLWPLKPWIWGIALVVPQMFYAMIPDLGGICCR
jgi:hypothetical protein